MYKYYGEKGIRIFQNIRNLLMYIIIKYFYFYNLFNIVTLKKHLTNLNFEEVYDE